MGFDVRSIDLSDIMRGSKQGTKSDLSYNSSAVTNSDKPLAGVTNAQRKRNRDIGDVLNIGAGTRCTHCGFLDFLWRETCATCGKPMEYNLGHRDEKKRM